MKKVLLLCSLLAVIGIGLFLFLERRPKATEVAREAEEQNISVAVLARTSAYSLEEYTTLGYLSKGLPNDFGELALDCGHLSVFTNTCHVLSFDYIGKDAPEVDREAVLDFVENNQQSYRVQDYLPFTNDHLLSLEDIQGMSDSGWFAFSRTGFNSTFTQALVLLSRVAKVNGEVIYCDAFYEILQKIDNQWYVKREVQVVHCELPPSQE